MVLTPDRSPRSRSRSLDREEAPPQKARPTTQKAKGQGKGRGQAIEVSSDEAEEGWGKWKGTDPPESSAGRPKPPATSASGSPPAPPFMPCWKYSIGDPCLFYSKEADKRKSSVVV